MNRAFVTSSVRIPDWSRDPVFPAIFAACSPVWLRISLEEGELVRDLIRIIDIAQLLKL